MFWDDRCGNVVDPDGYTWMVGTHKPEGAMVFSVPPFTFYYKYTKSWL
jgi:hypothetical protein